MPENEFEAWIHGPVNLDLCEKYSNFAWQNIPQKEDNSLKFNNMEIELLNSIWLTYGEMSANSLEAQTHIETPWRNARKGLGEFDKSHNHIKHEDMKNFYLDLYRQEQGE